MLRIAIIRTPRGLEALRSAWDRLFDISGQPSRFQSATWNLLAAQAFADRAVPLVVHAEGDSGAAIVPACTTNRGVAFLGDALFDYRDVLAVGDEQVLRRAWQQVAVAQQPLSLTALRGETPRQRWEMLGFAPKPFCGAPAVRNISAEEFAARHTRSARLLRRLERAGIEFRQHSGSDARLVRHIYDTKAQQPAAGENLFADPARVDFMVAIAALDAGCEVFTLESAGALVAALVSFRDGHVRLCYTVYHDRRWAHHSPGVALLFEVTRRSLQQGLECDYLTGEQPNKSRLANELTLLYQVEVQAAELARLCGCRVPVMSEGQASSLAA